MTSATVVHTFTAGTITAQVVRTPGRCQDQFSIVLHGEGSPVDRQEAQQQAEMYIAYQVQLARMAWCPSCGG
ncbi:MAG: hypothetical protein K1X74_06260 [Pirellulales bacterium]|nr:hypothetical protein [Pirellulales bacterium]